MLNNRSIDRPAGSNSHTAAFPTALMLASCLLATVAAESVTSSFSGEAFDLDTGELLYVEQHSLIETDGVPEQTTVRYVTPAGDQLALKEMTYWEPARPAYRLTVVDPQRTEVVSPDDNGVAVTSVKSGTVAWPTNATGVIDGGFHYFILEHFDTLLAGNTVEFEFLAPTRTTWTPLRVRPVEQVDGRLMLELNLQNRLLSWVISDIELTYSIDDHRLLQYSGLTNLPKPGGGNYKARIEYSYPQTVSSEVSK